MNINNRWIYLSHVYYCPTSRRYIYPYCCISLRLYIWILLFHDTYLLYKYYINKYSYLSLIFDPIWTLHYTYHHYYTYIIHFHVSVHWVFLLHTYPHSNNTKTLFHWADHFKNIPCKQYHCSSRIFLYHFGFIVLIILYILLISISIVIYIGFLIKNVIFIAGACLKS